MSPLDPGPRVGAHMSISGGLHRAPDRGAELGCEVIQLFLHNQVQWRVPRLHAEQVRAFRDRMRQRGLEGAVAHASYLLNLGSPDRRLREKSLRVLMWEIEAGQQLGLRGVILHPGSSRGGDRRRSVRYVVAALRRAVRAIDRNPLPFQVLIENSAGQGSSLAATIEEWYELVAAVGDPDRVGWCLDTCHLCAAGYPVHAASGYDEVMAQLEQRGMMRHMPVVHANDALRPCGSHVDRHAHIGEGTLGPEFFRRILQDPGFAHAWFILETPKDPQGHWDRENLARLKRFRSGEAARERSGPAV